MRYLLIASAAVLVCGVIAQEDITVKPLVEVYYDSGDLESQRFFRTQLEPLVRQIPDAFRLKLIPYVRTMTAWNQDKWWITCKRGIGYENCLGNQFHACILNSPLMSTQKLDIIFCLMRNDQPGSYSSFETCVADRNIFDIRSQHPGPMGSCVFYRWDDTLAQTEQTDIVKQPIKSQLRVYIYPQSEQLIKPNQLALTDLMGVVCDATLTRPSFCPPHVELVAILKDR